MKSVNLFAGAAALAVATVAFAHAETDAPPPVKARHAHMQLYAYNLGILGGMAQEKTPYDAELAQIAANNLASLAAMDETTYWVEGTSEGTKALPAIWENIDDFWDKQDGLSTEADRMAEVAGTDLAGLQGAMRDLGGTCSACHREYRARN